MSRLSRKGVVALLGLAGALVILVNAFRPWVTGSVDDAVLGATRISATGAEVAPGLSAVALALGAAAVAVVAAGRIARLVAVVAYAGCLAVTAGLALRVLADPGGVLGPVAAARVGRSGSIDAVASATAWPWVALLAVGVALLGLVGAVGGLRTWGGPSQRYEPPARDGGQASGPRGERVASDWDELSAGRDPTDVGPDAPT